VATYDVMVHLRGQIPALVDRAVRTSLAHRTVSHLTFPNDLQIAPADEAPSKGVAPARLPVTSVTVWTRDSPRSLASACVARDPRAPACIGRPQEAAQGSLGRS
jgi:thiamine pyrophosphate-dependent acetolactate synthase large subunit-like protein